MSEQWDLTGYPFVAPNDSSPVDPGNSNDMLQGLTLELDDPSTTYGPFDVSSMYFNDLPGNGLPEWQFQPASVPPSYPQFEDLPSFHPGPGALAAATQHISPQFLVESDLRFQDTLSLFDNVFIVAPQRISPNGLAPPSDQRSFASPSRGQSRQRGRGREHTRRRY